MSANTNFQSQSGRAMALGAIRDNMAGEKLLLPSQYVF